MNWSQQVLGLLIVKHLLWKNGHLRDLMTELVDTGEINVEHTDYPTREKLLKRIRDKEGL